MTMKSTHFAFACVCLAFTLKLYAQCPPPGTPAPGNTCATAPVFCGNLDGYCSTTDNNNPVHAFPGCTGFQLNNDEWLGFFAGTNTITFRITPSNCTDDGTTNTGLQGGIYATCGPGWIPKDLQCTCTEDPFILTSSNFVVGEIYRLVLDGCALQTCDFSIELLAGSTLGFPPADPGTIAGPSVVCQGSITAFSIPPVTGATDYFWTVTPTGAGTVTGSGPEINVLWSTMAGDTAQLCVTTGNACFGNPVPSCTSVAISPGPTPTMVVSGGGVLCGGGSTADVIFQFTGNPPWTFSYNYNGIPQPVLETSANPFVVQVNQPGVYSPQSVQSGICTGTVSGFALVTQSNISASFLTINAHCGFSDGAIDLSSGGGNAPYTFEWSGGQTTEDLTGIPAGMYSVTITESGGCSKILTINVLNTPFLLPADTISLCPGDSIKIGGSVYTSPGIVADTLPGTGGNCDTIAIYILRVLTPAPSVMGISCPPFVKLPGGMPVAVNYDLPVAASNCSCPGISLTLTDGLPSGSTFPTGTTAVCYSAKDSCGNTASCCFEIKIPEIPPCSAKTAGCIQYELLNITLDSSGNKRYRFRVTNHCPNKLIYTIFQLPNGIVALSPPDNSVYTAASGRTYEVRNPNNSPFHSIRFRSMSDSISGGASDIFEYTLPPQYQPAYIHVTARLEPQDFYEAYLGTLNCPVALPPPVQRAARGASMLIFPNPATGTLYVDLSAWQGERVQIQLFDSRWRQVQRSELTAEAAAQAIPLPASMANGVYFLEIKTGDGERQLERFVLMH